MTSKKSASPPISPKKGRSPLLPSRSASEYALLGLLLDGPSHGYDLARQFAVNTQLGKVCRLEMSMLYGLLRKLEREGIISGREENLGEGKTRRMVELTEAGRQEFEAWLHQPVQHNREMRFSFLVKLYFASLRGDDLLLKLLDDQIEFTQNWLNQFLARKQPTNEATDQDSDFEEWVLDFRVEQTNAALRWLAHCRYQIQRRRRTQATSS